MTTVLDDLDLGVATHTGRQRRSNEDDYLVLMPRQTAAAPAGGRLFAVADGMGGTTGGAEASRAAVRALATVFVDGDPALSGIERLREGFERACERVFALSTESAGLRGMGTTLTACFLSGEKLFLGHIGDSRCYLLRAGALRVLTTDHSTQEGGNRLTRCVGGGRPREAADLIALDVQSGDRLLLATDGLWNTVGSADLARVLASAAPQAAADELVRLANDAGGPDNCTALVIDILRIGGAPARPRQLALPREEAAPAQILPRTPAPIGSPRWPWLGLLIAGVLGGLAAAKAIYGLDLIELLM